jgi:tRNA pseudouridine38-40 synthase
MAVSATVPARWAPDALRRALNALLPPDCWVVDVREVQSGFHARKSATSRAYRYRVGTDPAARSPFRHPFEWALARDLDGEVLRQAAAAVIGAHDFRAFAVGTADKENCRCSVRRAEWQPRPEGAGWEFAVEADRFLHHLVRILVGTMVDAALGRRPVGDMARLLDGDPATRASPPAPPNGLYFVEATYPDRWFRLGDDPT